MHNKSPFPYFGGKLKAASLIWERLGADCKNYVEPFFGSGAVLLNRPDSFSGQMTVNDKDGHVSNFWRAVRADPTAVARCADWPVIEADLHARHLYLVNNAEKLTARLMANHCYFDAQMAGFWAWGACMWIGSGWCNGDGPWGAVDVDGVAEFQRLDAGTGVNRQIPHLGDAGKGVHSGNTNNRLEFLNKWFEKLSNSLRGVRICNGDWGRIMSIGTMTRFGTCGVLLDPPYSQTKAVYATDSNTVSHDVRKWCVEHGENLNLRIALCGHDGEHNELEQMGWTVETWDKPAGYQGADDSERIWFSPHCVAKQFDLFGGTL